jgi:two-component system NtrC family sensor kinase
MNALGRPIRIVYLEDDVGAAALVQALLRRECNLLRLERVEDEAGFVNALQLGAPDAILADFNLPTMTGWRALELRQERCPTTPFIFVSGAFEENAEATARHLVRRISCTRTT